MIMVPGQKNIIKINLGITHWKCQKLNQKKENNENFILCHSETNIYYRRLVLGRFIFYLNAQTWRNMPNSKLWNKYW